MLAVVFQGGKHADGGVESFTQLAERYRGVRLTILTQGESKKNHRWREAGCDVLVSALPYKPGERTSLLSKLWHHLRWNLRTAWLALNERIDVVHVNDPHALWHVVAGLRLVGLPVIYNIRDTKPCLSKGAVLKWQLAFALTQAQIVLSHEMRRFWMEATRTDGRRLIAIYSVVDFEQMRPLPEMERKVVRSKLGLGGFSVGYVASFSEKKAQLRFIEKATAKLRTMPASSRLYFLGDFDPQSDPYARACLEAAQKSGAGDRFIFKGYTPAMHLWYQALDTVVVATRNEGLARCMIESLASGTPVVSFDVCSAQEILRKGPCGAVARQGDYDGLMEALAELADDPGKRAEYGRRGADLARQLFDPRENVDRYEHVYAMTGDQGVVV